MCTFTRKVLDAASLPDCVGVIVVDNQEESLVTMDSGDDPVSQDEERRINAAAGFVSQAVGAELHHLLMLAGGEDVQIELTWPNVPPGPGSSRVALAMWTTTQDECAKCASHKAFISSFHSTAYSWMQSGYLTFEPRYVILPCPSRSAADLLCRTSCINDGRYCLPDPDGDPLAGYSGRDVVMADARSLCLFDALSSAKSPALWWNYTTAMADACSFSAGKYSITCSDDAIQALGVPGVTAQSVATCVGDPSADARNALLDAQQAAQSSIALFPTLVANGLQYRGDVELPNVLQFLCSAFVNGAMAPPECEDQLPGSRGRACDANSYGDQACAADVARTGQVDCRAAPTYPYYSCQCPRGETLQAGRCAAIATSPPPPPPPPQSAEDGNSHSTPAAGRRHGMSGGAVFAIILLVSGAAGGISYAAHRWHRQRSPYAYSGGGGGGLNIGLASYHELPESDEGLD